MKNVRKFMVFMLVFLMLFSHFVILNVSAFEKEVYNFDKIWYDDDIGFNKNNQGNLVLAVTYTNNTFRTIDYCNIVFTKNPFYFKIEFEETLETDFEGNIVEPDNGYLYLNKNFVMSYIPDDIKKLASKNLNYETIYYNNQYWFRINIPSFNRGYEWGEYNDPDIGEKWFTWGNKESIVFKNRAMYIKKIKDVSGSIEFDITHPNSNIGQMIVISKNYLQSKGIINPVFEWKDNFVIKTISYNENTTHYFVNPEHFTVIGVHEATSGEIYVGFVDNNKSETGASWPLNSTLAGTIFAQQTTSASGTATEDCWQSFTEPESYVLTKLQIEFQYAGDSNVSIRDNTGSTVYDYVDKSHGQGWVEFDCENLVLRPGVEYRFYVEGASVTEPFKMITNLYANGRASTGASDDLTFKLYGFSLNGNRTTGVGTERNILTDSVSCDLSTSNTTTIVVPVSSSVTAITEVLNQTSMTTASEVNSMSNVVDNTFFYDSTNQLVYIGTTNLVNGQFLNWSVNCSYGTSFSISFPSYKEVGDDIFLQGVIKDNNGDGLNGIMADTYIYYSNGSIALGPYEWNCTNGNFYTVVCTSSLIPGVYSIGIEFEDTDTSVTFKEGNTLYLSTTPSGGVHYLSNLYFSFYDNDTGEGLNSERFKIYVSTDTSITSSDRIYRDTYKTYTGDILYYRIDDYFNNQIYPLSGSYETVTINSVEQFEDVPINWHSFSVKNMNHSIVRFNMTNSSRTYSQYLFPYEPFYWNVLTGDYTINLTYYNTETDNIEDYSQEDISISGDTYYWITGYDLQDIVIEISNSNTTIMDQIVNIGVNINNDGSNIIHQVLNTNIALNNIETNITNQVNLIWSSVNNTKTTILNQVNSVWQSVNNTESEIGVQANKIGQSILNTESNMTVQINDVWQSVNNTKTEIGDQANLVKQDISNFHNNITTQVNGVWQDVNNTNSTVHTQLNNIVQDIANVNSNITTQVSYIRQDISNTENNITVQLNSVWQTVNNTDSSITTQINSLSQSLTNTETNITTQITTVRTDITNFESNITSQVNGVSLSITNSETNIKNQINLVWTKVNNTNTGITTQINSVQSQVTNFETNITTQLNNIQVDIANHDTNLTNQINNVQLDITNTNTTIHNQLNAIITDIINTNSTVINQANMVLSQITNTETNITTQLNSIQTDITNSETNVINQVNLVWTEINNTDSSIDAQLNGISASITNTETNLTTQLNDIDIKITNTESNIKSQINLVWTDINNTNTTIHNQLNNIISDISNTESNIVSQTNLILSTVSNIEGNLTSQVNLVWNSVNNTNSNINTQINLVTSSITNTETNLTNQLNNVQISITNTESNLSSQVNSVNINITNSNTSIMNQLNSIVTYISNTNSTVINQANFILSQITNTETNITNQLNTIQSQITTSESNLSTQINIVQTQITNTETNITTQLNVMETIITNIDTNITNQFNIVKTQITNMETNLSNQISYINVTVINNNSNISSQLNTIISSISNTNSTVVDQANLIISTISNTETNITNQLNSIQTQITNTESNITSQVNIVLTQITNTETNITTQLNVMENTINNIDTNMTTQFNIVEVQITNTETNLSNQINTVNTTITNHDTSIDNQLNTILSTIQNTNLSMVNQLNLVWNTINTTNSTIYGQIIGTHTTITTMWSNLNYSFSYIDSNITYSNNTIHNLINDVNATLFAKLVNVIDNVSSGGESVISKVLTVLNNLSNINTTLHDEVISKSLEILDNVSQGSTSIFEHVTDVLNNLTGINMSLHDKIVNKALDVINSVSSEHLNTVLYIVENLTSINTSIFGEISSKALDIMNNVTEQANENMVEILNVISDISEINTSIFGEIQSKALDIMENITQQADQNMNEILNVSLAVGQLVGDNLSSMINNITIDVKNLINDVGNISINISSNITVNLTSVLENLSNIMDNLNMTNVTIGDLINVSIDNLTDITVRMWQSTNNSFWNLENRSSTVVFSFYNTNYGLGLDRETLLVYINGTRLINNLYYCSNNTKINLTIKDYYNFTLYHNNFTISGAFTFIDLGLTFHSYLFGNKNNDYYMISLLKEGASRWWERGIVPYGEREYLIPSGNYSLRIYDKDYDEIYNDTASGGDTINNSKVYIIHGVNLTEIISGQSVIRGQLLELGGDLDYALMPDEQIYAYNPCTIFSVFDRLGMLLGLDVWEVCPVLNIIAVTENSTYSCSIDSYPLIPSNGTTANGTIGIVDDVLYISGNSSVNYINITYKNNGTLMQNTTYIPGKINLNGQNLTITSNCNIHIIRETTYSQTKKFYWNIYNSTINPGPISGRAGYHSAGFTITNPLGVEINPVYVYAGFSDKTTPDANTVVVQDIENGVTLERGEHFKTTGDGIEFKIDGGIPANNEREFTVGYYKNTAHTYYYEDAQIEIRQYTDEKTLSTDNKVYKYSEFIWINDKSLAFRGSLRVKLGFDVDLDHDSVKVMDLDYNQLIDDGDIIVGDDFIWISSDSIGTVQSGGSRSYGIYFQELTYPGQNLQDIHLNTPLIMPFGIPISMFTILAIIGMIIIGSGVFLFLTNKNKDRYILIVLFGFAIIIFSWILTAKGI